MPRRDIVVIGASAGGVEAVVKLASQLPADFPASVFITLHFPPTVKSVLPRVLDRSGPLRAVHPVDGEKFEPGTIYVAPPDYHLLLGANQHIRLVRGPVENGNRPAVDPMFRSAAVHYGARVIGVVLSGTLDDGTAGMLAITRRGGVGVVQDPEDALYASMPESALAHGGVKHSVPLAEMSALLQDLVSETAIMTNSEGSSDDAVREHAYSKFELEAIEEVDTHPGLPSPFGCPDCGGVLWGIQDGNLMRFRCRVGHGWTQDGLLLQQTETVDSALWTALRALEENAHLHRQLAERMSMKGISQLAERHLGSAEVAERRAQVIRNAIVDESSSRGDASSSEHGSSGTNQPRVAKAARKA